MSGLLLRSGICCRSRHDCFSQTPELLLASASNLVADSEQFAKEGRIEEAIQGFKTAQKWDPSLRFDPVARANQLANEAKQEK